MGVRPQRRRVANSALNAVVVDDALELSRAAHVRVSTSPGVGGWVGEGAYSELQRAELTAAAPDTTSSGVCVWCVASIPFPHHDMSLGPPPARETRLMNITSDMSSHCCPFQPTVIVPHTGKPTGVAVSHCITRFQTQLIPHYVSDPLPQSFVGSS